MTNHKFPKTPLATPLAQPGKVTRQRIRRIVRFPKMKRPPAVFLVLAALSVLLCGNLAACQSAEEAAQGGTPLNNPAEDQTPPALTLPPSEGNSDEDDENLVDADGALSLLRQEEADMLSDALLAAVQNEVEQYLERSYYDKP